MSNPTADLATDEQIHNELIRPAHVFKGVELWEWSRSARHLWKMISSSENDLVIFHILALIWLLKKRTESTAAQDFRKHILRRVYDDLTGVRAEIIFWRDELSDDDEKEARRIYNAIMQAENATEISVSSGASGSQKKTTATPRQNGDS